MSSSTAGNGQLQGLRVFVVEDEALIALMLEDLLTAFGCGVVGPLGRLAAAQRAAQSRDFDCAILDVNINGDPVYGRRDPVPARHPLHLRYRLWRGPRLRALYRPAALSQT